MVSGRQKEFRTRLIDAGRKLHPSYPEHLTFPIRQFDLKKANGLTQAIVYWINQHGAQAERINSTGRPIDNRKTVKDVIGRERIIGTIQWIPGTSTSGTADISATIPLKKTQGIGASVKIEVKIGADRQSEAQKKYEETINRAGGIYIIVKNIDDFLTWWDENAQI